jgi:hypothetical protein
MVTLERIWAAPYIELVAVLASSRPRKVVVPDDINIVRELVARIYYRTSLLDKEDAILLTNPSFREIMSSKNTFKTRYVTLQISSLDLDMAKTTQRYESKLITSLYAQATEPTLYIARNRILELRNPVTLELKRIISLPSGGSIVYFDNKIFSFGDCKFSYIDLTTYQTILIANFGTAASGPYLMSGRVYLLISGLLMVYHQGQVFQCSKKLARTYYISFDRKSEAMITSVGDDNNEFMVIGANVEAYTVTFDVEYMEEPLMVHDGHFYYKDFENGTVSISDRNGHTVGQFEDIDHDDEPIVELIAGDNSCFISTWTGDIFQIHEYTFQGKFIRHIKLENPYTADISYMFFCAGRLIVRNNIHGTLSISTTEDSDEDVYVNKDGSIQLSFGKRRLMPIQSNIFIVKYIRI